MYLACKVQPCLSSLNWTIADSSPTPNCSIGHAAGVYLHTYSCAGLKICPMVTIHEHMSRRKNILLLKDAQLCTHLHGLPKAHLISKDAVQSPLIHGHQPVQPNVLVLSQLVPQKKRHLGLHLHTRRNSSVHIIICHAQVIE